MSIKKGSKVTVEYEGSLEDGTIFDSSSQHGHSHPLEFTAGEGEVIKGFDEAIIGMNEGEEKTIEIESKDAYGEYNPQLKQKIPKSSLNAEGEPKAGMTLVIGTPDGKQFPVKILEVDEENITIDLNHPLAGKKLTFKVKVVKIE